MTPVKDKLSGRQYVLEGLDSDGRTVYMYLSNEVTGRLHVNLNGKEFWVNPDKLLDIIGFLKFGEKYDLALRRNKEAKHAKHDMDL